MSYKSDIEWRRLIAEYGPPRGGSRAPLTFDEVALAVAERRALHFERLGNAFSGSTMLVRLVRLGDSIQDCMVFSRPCALTEESVGILHHNSWEDRSDVPWMVYPELTGEDALRAARANEAERRSGKH